MDDRSQYRREVRQRAIDDALAVFAQQIRLARARWNGTVEQIAAISGVTVTTVERCEAADPTVEIGDYFKVASGCGLILLGFEGPDLARARARGDQQIALLATRAPHFTTDAIDSLLDI